jgi:hypothetical protein
MAITAQRENWPGIDPLKTNVLLIMLMINVIDGRKYITGKERHYRS